MINVEGFLIDYLQTYGQEAQDLTPLMLCTESILTVREARERVRERLEGGSARSKVARLLSTRVVEEKNGVPIESVIVCDNAWRIVDCLFLTHGFFVIFMPKIRPPEGNDDKYSQYKRRCLL